MRSTGKRLVTKCAWSVLISCIAGRPSPTAGMGDEHYEEIKAKRKKQF
jgi:hypothetical protein